jgi:hypothetical protein
LFPFFNNAIGTYSLSNGVGQFTFASLSTPTWVNVKCADISGVYKDTYNNANDHYEILMDNKATFDGTLRKRSKTTGAWEEQGTVNATDVAAFQFSAFKNVVGQYSLSANGQGQFAFPGNNRDPTWKAVPKPIDCNVSYGVWSQCSANNGKGCGPGTQNRTISITQNAAHEGIPCPTALTETQSCTLSACYYHVTKYFSWERNIGGGYSYLAIEGVSKSSEADARAIVNNEKLYFMKDEFKPEKKDILNTGDYTYDESIWSSWIDVNDFETHYGGLLRGGIYGDFDPLPPFSW